MERKSVLLVSILGALTAIGPLCTDLYLPALPEITSHLNTTSTLTQLSLTSTLIGLGLGQLFFGPLSDRVGRKKPLIVSLVIFLLSTVFCALSQSIYTFIAWRFIQGAAGAGGAVLARSIARDKYSGGKLTQFFALLMAVNGIAPILSPVIGGYISSYFDWRVLFWGLSVVAAVLIFISVIFLDESMRKPEAETSMIKNVKSVFYNKKFLMFCFIQSFMMAGLFSYIGSSSFVLQNQFKLSPLEFSLVFGGNGAGLVLMSLVFSRLSRHFKSEILLRTGLTLALIAAVITFLLAWLQMYLPSLIALFFTVSFNSGISTVAGSEAMNAVKENESGTASALLGMLMFVFGGIATPLAGIGGETAINMSFAILLSYALAFVLSVSADKVPGKFRLNR